VQQPPKVPPIIFHKMPIIASSIPFLTAGILNSFSNFYLTNYLTYIFIFSLKTSHYGILRRKFFTFVVKNTDSESYLWWGRSLSHSQGDFHWLKTPFISSQYQRECSLKSTKTYRIVSMWSPNWLFLIKTNPCCLVSII